jgi:hypothetical protein
VDSAIGLTAPSALLRRVMLMAAMMGVKNALRRIGHLVGAGKI